MSNQTGEWRTLLDSCPLCAAMDNDSASESSRSPKFTAGEQHVASSSPDERSNTARAEEGANNSDKDSSESIVNSTGHAPDDSSSCAFSVVSYDTDGDNPTSTSFQQVEVALKDNGSMPSAVGIDGSCDLERMVEEGDWRALKTAADQFKRRQDDEALLNRAGVESQGQNEMEKIRADVEALIRRVVPEESENLDEIMTQFRGRESSLLDTLRAMDT